MMKPLAKPTMTSLVQCASVKIRVSEIPIVAVQVAAFNGRGKSPAADASAPMCMA